MTLNLTIELDGSEFGSGLVTGKINHAAFWGGLLLLVATILTMRSQSFAMFLMAGSVFLIVPLYIYQISPKLVQMLFPGDYSVPALSWFYFDSYAVVGLSFLLMVVGLGWRINVAKTKRSRDT